MSIFESVVVRVKTQAKKTHTTTRLLVLHHIAYSLTVMPSLTDGNGYTAERTMACSALFRSSKSLRDASNMWF